MSEKITVQEMTKKDIIELEVQELVMAIKCGFPDTFSFYEFRNHATEGMIKYGGSFAYSLGHTLRCADIKNAYKILITWPDECKHHAGLWKAFLVKRNSESGE